jgi:hypothetical protein
VVRIAGEEGWLTVKKLKLSKNVAPENRASS